MASQHTSVEHLKQHGPTVLAGDSGEDETSVVCNMGKFKRQTFSQDDTLAEVRITAPQFGFLLPGRGRLVGELPDLPVLAGAKALRLAPLKEGLE